MNITWCTAQKMNFSIKGFFSKYDQIRSFLRIWSHLLKKFLMKKFIFCALVLTRLALTATAERTVNTIFLSAGFFLYKGVPIKNKMKEVIISIAGTPNASG